MKRSKLAYLRCGGKNETTQDYIVHTGFVWKLGRGARRKPRQHRAGRNEHDSNLTNQSVSIDQSVAFNDAIFASDTVA